MGCCIALALVIGLARMAWFRLARRRPPSRAGFAPPARRAAPGGPTEPAPPAPVGRPEPVLIGAGLVAAVLAVMFRVNRRHLALALVGGGASWSLLSVLDMHLTGVVSAHHHHGNALADIALHGPGFLAVVLGVAALLTAQPLTTRGTR